MQPMNRQTLKKYLIEMLGWCLTQTAIGMPCVDGNDRLRSTAQSARLTDLQ